jgi:hypothetical protein
MKDNQSICYICGDVVDDSANYTFCAKCGGKLEKPKKIEKIEVQIDADRIAKANAIAALVGIDGSRKPAAKPAAKPAVKDAKPVEKPKTVKTIQEAKPIEKVEKVETIKEG